MTSWPALSRKTGRSASRQNVGAHLPTTKIVARDKASLDIFWLKDQDLEDLESLPEPDVLAEEIAEDLRAALEQFNALTEGLERKTV